MSQPKRGAEQQHGLRYAPGLDGVRALAVFAVVAYHIGTTSAATVLPGGFLGVDVFFVLSGYLITSLLIVEVQQSGRISIKKFYIRRARRLLPALYAMLLAVAAVGAFWLPQQAARLRGDLLASLGYVTNWWLIAEDSSYFATAGDRPPMLTHLWSLAVEEQYYVVWPLVLMLFAALRVRRGLMLLLVGLGIAGSLAAGYLLYDPFSDPSRVYYGTDTRALAPLLGAFLAIAVKPWQHRRRLPRGARHGLDLLGITALLGLAGVAATVRDTDELLYRGGFLGIALLGAAVVAVAGHPGTALGEMLGTQPLRYLGERSYAIYLWHWPVCLLTRPGLDVPFTGWANAGLRIAASIVLAEISYQIIEKPIRRYGFLAPLRRKKSTETSTVDVPAQAPQPLRTPTGQHAVRTPTGQHPLHTPTGPHPLHTATGPHPLHALRAPTPAPRGAGVYVAASHGGAVYGSPPPALTPPAPAQPAEAPAARQRGPIVRTAVLTVALIAGGTFVGMRLTAAASTPTEGGPRDVGADVALGPLLGPSAPASPVPMPPKPVPPGSTVAFFGDSQGMTLLLNKPPDLDDYIKAVDATIEGCGILLGKVESRSGERRNLTSNCANWRSIWTDRESEYEPVLAIIMLGAWDVFDLTLDSGQTLRFGTPAWDANFTDALRSAVGALRSGKTDVALALLPCYRPIDASAGYWPERGDDDRTRHVNKLLRTHAQTYLSGVRTLEPPGEFCADPTIAEDTAYRWDGVHYYKRGAALYFGTMLPQIMPPPPPATPAPSPSPAV